MSLIASFDPFLAELLKLEVERCTVCPKKNLQLLLTINATTASFFLDTMSQRKGPSISYFTKQGTGCPRKCLKQVTHWAKTNKDNIITSAL